jgi:GNAT superfamily N-acetyltransferase
MDHILVPVNALDIVWLLYAARLDCQARKSWYSRIMNIRKATPTDSLVLSRLSRDVQSMHAQNHPTVFRMPDSDEFAVPFFEEKLADSAVTILIAEENGQATGCIVCKLIERPENPFTFAARTMLIDQISVLPEARGKGIGAALMQQAEGLAEELNVPRILLDSWGFNIKAHKFFESQGFAKFNFRFWKWLQGK